MNKTRLSPHFFPPFLYLVPFMWLVIKYKHLLRIILFHLYDTKHVVLIILNPSQTVVKNMQGGN